MKTSLLSFVFVLVSTTLIWAQSTTINASEIVARINKGDAISYKNATIVGDLDLTELSTKRQVKNCNWGSTEQFESLVAMPLLFDNCQFTGKFIACKYDQQIGKNGTTFTANFQEPVTFTNCTFDGEAGFKYTKFQQRAVFSGSQFNGDVVFKYTKFLAAVDFNNTQFKKYADFKYARISESSSFQQVKFAQYADFKYTQFDEPTDFQGTRFVNTADFKYTHFPRGTRFDNAHFDGGTEFKYTTLDGQQFVPAKR
ncbi:pentapeptide repeat-containing protein [Spirosoma rhododendri]|uniref:Pentapeptide repeat-containing protein n=1 Tax=Spirosoma rhododendri TaxID=2728024 RepID=A0A7L5DKP2_9BACT|nr:pentapeptide repeat-containing protein [Spirosoma rhododendri]QJD77743.1 hypothetical protein HH216_04385 [Spirosoma rhododendri]